MVTIRGLFRPQTSKMNLFVKTFNVLQQKTPCQMFEWILNTPLTMVTHTEALNVVISKTSKPP